MKKRIFLILSLLPGLVGLAKSKATDTSVTHNAKLTLFWPGEIQGAGKIAAAPAFAPDGKTVYFGQFSEKKEMVIVTSVRSGDKWSVPVLAPFSVIFGGLEPAFSPDGKNLVFASSRPLAEGGAKIDGNWNGQVYAGSGGNLWRVPVSKKGPGTPQLLPIVINQNTSIFSPAITGDGSLYFMRADSGKKFHISRSQFKNGEYQPPVLASFVIDKYGDFDPAVSPDESFLIFSSGRPPAPPKTADLFIIFRTPNGWSEPIDLRTALGENVFGVEARLSPDCKTLYFSNSRNAMGIAVEGAQYIWRVDISELLKEHGVDRIGRRVK